MNSGHDGRFGCERPQGGFVKDRPTTKVRSYAPIIIVSAGLACCALLSGSAMAGDSGTIIPSSLNDLLNWVANELLRLKTR